MSIREIYKGTHLRRQILKNESDLGALRLHLKFHASNSGFSRIARTKLLTAARELARNTILHGKGGFADVERIQVHPSKVGVLVAFQDNGPGMADIEAALIDGYSTTGGLGLGLGGSRRLVDEFEIQSTVDCGTTVVVVKWRT